MLGGLVLVLAWFGRTHPTIGTSGWGFLALIGIVIVTAIAWEADEKQRSR